MICSKATRIKSGWSQSSGFFMVAKFAIQVLFYQGKKSVFACYFSCSFKPSKMLFYFQALFKIVNIVIQKSDISVAPTIVGFFSLPQASKVCATVLFLLTTKTIVKI